MNDWFQLEVIADGTTLIVRVNNREVARASSTAFTKGSLGFMVRTGGELQIRNLEIKELPDRFKVKTSAPAVTQREALEWVLAQGGSLLTRGEGKPFAQVKTVPSVTSSVISVSLQNNRTITDADLARIGVLHDLNFLVLDNTPVTDDGLAHLRPLKQLIALHLTRTNIRGEGLQHLKDMSQLQTLHLERTEIGEAGLKHLRGLPRLGVLQLANTNVNDAAMAHLKECPRLVTLVLWDTTVGDEGLKHLAEIKSLRYLELNRTRVSAAGVQALAKALPTCWIKSEHGEFGPKVAP
jgi:hypothetical protein